MWFVDKCDLTLSRPEIGFDVLSSHILTKFINFIKELHKKRGAVIKIMPENNFRSMVGFKIGMCT